MKTSDALAAIRDANKALQRAGVRYWLDCGSLLGAVREGGIMAHDLDVDFGCFDPAKYKRVANAMAAAKFKPYRNHGSPNMGFEQRFVHRSGVRVDVFYFYEGTVRNGVRVDDPELCWQGSYGDRGNLLVSEFPRAIVAETQPLTFAGVTVPVPIDAEAMLEARYGDWRIPVTKWDYRTDPKCLVEDEVLPSAMEDVTFIIKNFLRPKLTLACVLSIRSTYGDVPILVVDDSKATRQFEKDLARQNASLLRLPYDSGLSAGRNAGVKAVKTSKVVLLDDDMLVTKDSHIPEMVLLLDHCDVVCGSMRQNGRIIEWQGTYDLRPDGLRLLPLRKKFTTKGAVRCAPVDFGLNVLASTTEFLKAHPWDERLKLSEHTSFFLDLKAAGGKVLFAPDSIVDHRPQRDSQYRAYRRRKEFRLLFFHKHGFKYHIGYTGVRDEWKTSDQKALEELLAKEAL